MTSPNRGLPMTSGKRSRLNERTPRSFLEVERQIRDEAFTPDKPINPIRAGGVPAQLILELGARSLPQSPSLSCAARCARMACRAFLPTAASFSYSLAGSFQPIRVLAQKIAAVTDCGPSPVAFLKSDCATAVLARM